MNKRLNELIIENLKEKSPISIEELSNKLLVSKSTIRRKLNKLQDDGIITRSYGKAYYNDTKHFMPAFAIRKADHSLEKKKITFEALKFIKDGYTIFLDASTSAHFLAQYLSEFKNLTVITNGVDTLSTLANMQITAYSTGGKVCAENSSALVGLTPLNSIPKIHADIFFFSVKSVDSLGNCYDISDEENEVRRLMIENSSKSILLCDSSKFGYTTTFKLCNIKDIDVLITDKNIVNDLSINEEDLPDTIICK